MDSGLVLAIDGNSLVHRSYHAQARTGVPFWAVRGLLTQLVAAVERIRPSAVVIGFDDPEASQRRARWPQYKAQRGDKLSSLVQQLARAAEVMRELGVAVEVPTALEADDVLASTARHAREHGMQTVIVTSDRDAFALIDDATRVLRIINGGVDASPLMTAERLVLLLGVRPDQYRDFAALRGDPSDNLPGVRGIGPRSAARLLAEFGTAEAAFADLDAVAARLGGTIARRLADPTAHVHWERNCQVMTMRCDLPVAPGPLPLDPDRVAAAFRAQQLTWTTAEAVRVLAGVADEPRQPPRWIDGWDDRTVRSADGYHSGSSRTEGYASRRLPRLPPRKPAMAQLTLFD